jgi:hypothetical protein
MWRVQLLNYERERMSVKASLSPDDDKVRVQLKKVRDEAGREHNHRSDLISMIILFYE